MSKEKTKAPEGEQPEKKKKNGPISRIKNRIDAVDRDYDDRSASRKTIISLFRLKVPFIFTVVLILAGFAVFFMIRSNNTATMEMGLNYEESAYGLNPNSTHYNVYELVSQEVLEKALWYAGIDAGTVDLTEFQESLSIKTADKKAFSQDDPFITTSYRITLEKPKSITGVSAKVLLSFVCKAYKDYLYENYTENRSILSFDIDQFNDGEYLAIADLLDMKAGQIVLYLNGRVKESKSFTEQESDETFRSLMQKVEDIRLYDIEKYRSFVIQAGISRNKARFFSALDYTDRNLQLDYNKAMAAYEEFNKGIKLYSDNIISKVMIPSVDQSKNTYYMATTKTGLDYMAESANNYLLTAEEIDHSLRTNEELIVKMKAGTNAAEDVEKAETMIEAIRTKLNGLSQQIETVDKAYIRYRTKDYLTFKQIVQSFMDRMGVKKLIVIAVGLVALVFGLIWLRFRFFGGGDEK